jgi:hypothetical protein
MFHWKWRKTHFKASPRGSVGIEGKTMSRGILIASIEANITSLAVPALPMSVEDPQGTLGTRKSRKSRFPDQKRGRKHTYQWAGQLARDRGRCYREKYTSAG